MIQRLRMADAEEHPASQKTKPGLLIDDLAAQLDRFKLLPGGSTADAERVLSGLTPRSPREREATQELAVRTILAHPQHFEEAHHLTVKALEVFDRHGWRDPLLPRWLGPLRPLAAYPVELVAKVIVKSYARDVANQMRRLYERREAQCAFDQPERRPLTRARIAMVRLAPDFAGASTGLPKFLVGGAVLSGLASAAKQLGNISGSTAVTLAILGAILFVVFAGDQLDHRARRLRRPPALDADHARPARGALADHRRLRRPARGRLAHVRDGRHRAHGGRLVRDAGRRRGDLLLRAVARAGSG